MSSEADPERELPPCPFCGGEDIYIEPDEIGSGGQWVYPLHIGCKSCGCEQVDFEGDSRADAASRWNRRARGTTARAALPEPAVRQLLDFARGHPDLTNEERMMLSDAAEALSWLIEGSWCTAEEKVRRALAALSPQPAPPNSAQGDSTASDSESPEAVGNVCSKCGGPMRPGKAIAQTWGGSPDFIGGEVVTMSPGGPGRLIDCLKCARCGWSVTPTASGLSANSRSDKPSAPSGDHHE